MYEVINLEKKDHSNKYRYLVKILKLPTDGKERISALEITKTSMQLFK